ncbi:hypothetical protein BJ508DRAFT_129769 [Ascobolus immersus RN42]|uniref:CST complex subunit Ten1 n=1 Tax=Ascobolus immersus RN42 TaxID=1160509 RepID=A0A3N4I710_ASCIM|nr:hypothetical protein BJ508DRAFT_129769 [Ascobolus immersus RN42]
MSSAGLSGSRFTCISELGGAEHLEKVRFIGCITAYDPQTAVITLHHRYVLERRVGQTTVLSYDVDVDATIALEHVDFNECHLRDREWVDVVGYVIKKRDMNSTDGSKGFYVQATQIKSVGQTFDLAKYERSIEGRIEMS